MGSIKMGIGLGLWHLPMVGSMTRSKPGVLFFATSTPTDRKPGGILLPSALATRVARPS